ncbi:MAG TPA: hypothetical protein V6D13_00830 [Halomicronema sp.]
MNTQEQARMRMMVQQHHVKNRQQSMLSRVSAEVGIDEVQANQLPRA